MKTFLVPTDFSDNAQKAIDYAAELAKLLKAKIILFNVYNLPVVPSEIPTVLPLHELEKESKDSLGKIEKGLHLKHGDKLMVESKCSRGFPVDEINYYVEEHKVEMIVIGMEGAGYLTEKLIGNITTSLIKKARCPVLVIDKHVKFKALKNIMLAVDFGEIQNKSILDPLIKLANLFGAHIDVLNVAPQLEAVPSVSKTLERIKFDHMLLNIDHSFNNAINDNTIKGINDFVEENKTDMVVMIPRMHNGFQSFFFEPNTRRMAFHTKVPLLLLHE